jgi:hypothetical protein
MKVVYIEALTSTKARAVDDAENAKTVDTDARIVPSQWQKSVAWTGISKRMLCGAPLPRSPRQMRSTSE